MNEETKRRIYFTVAILGTFAILMYSIFLNLNVEKVKQQTVKDCNTYWKKQMVETPSLFNKIEIPGQERIYLPNLTTS
jgi:hypothetical protein